MIKIALVEDDSAFRTEISQYLERYSAEKGEKLEVSVFTDGDEIAIGYKAKYDIILLDIQMRFMDGLTAAREIRRRDEEVIIIFVTNSPQYAISGYEVNALDYILKPVNYYALSKTLDRAFSRIKRQEKKYIFISNQQGTKKIEEGRILYVEVNGHNLIYHTLEGDFGAVGSMTAVEESLDEESFFRCNKCFLVNLEHVDAVEGDDVIVKGTPVQLSRSKKKLIMDAMNAYLARRT
ncbi:MAG: response regulator transcription factor [Oscillospiraceae bacterium]|nr:response regulator transcription factor [Oscillospiraceae bacterium]